MPRIKSTVPNARQVAREMLLDGRTPTEIAAKLGVNYSTVRRWRLDPEFARRMDAELDARLRMASDRSSALLGMALDYAELALDPKRNEDVPHVVRAKVMIEVMERTGLVTRSPPSSVIVNANGTGQATASENIGAVVRWLADSGELQKLGWTPPAAEPAPVPTTELTDVSG